MYMIGIYKIESPSGKVYIGQSVDIDSRWKKYQALNCDNQTKLLNSFSKYGVDSHTFEILEECVESKLNERERYWQDYYNVVSDGLNCRLTETTDKSGRLSEETKNRIGNANRGRVHSEQSKLNMSKPKSDSSRMGKYNRNGKLNPFYGKTHSEETKAKIREKRKKQIITEETKQKISEALLGREVSDDTKRKISNSNKGKPKPESMKIKFGRPVLQYTLDGEFIKEYYSSQEAADKLGVGKLSIYNAASGRSKTSSGYVWKFKY